MNRIAIATLVIGIAGLVFAAVAPARAAGSAQQVPDGTLTYKVVLTGHGARNNLAGPDASIAKSTHSVHEVLEATIRLKGAVDSGTVNAKGFTKAKPLGAAGSMGFAQKMQACHGNQACMLKLAKALSAKENGGAMARLHSQIGALQLWIQQPLTTCTAKVAIANRETMSGKIRQGRDVTGQVMDSPVPPSRSHFTQRTTTTAQHGFGCQLDANNKNGDAGKLVYGTAAEIIADPGTGYYVLHLPEFTIKSTWKTDNNLDGGGAGTTGITIPRLELTGLKLPAAGKPFHGKRHLRAVFKAPGGDTTIRYVIPDTSGLPSEGGDFSYTYANTASRPAVPLDAVVTWTFTPDKR